MNVASHDTTATVILAAPISKSFSYINEKNVQIGSIVSAPCRGTSYHGIVLAITPYSHADSHIKLKKISQVYEIPPISPVLLSFTKWVSDYTLSKHGSIIKMLLPNKNLLLNTPILNYDSFVSNTLKSVELSDLQKQVTEKIWSTCKSFVTHLVYGTTGSGKTEIYLEIAIRVLASKGQVLILLPEILLATQLSARVRSRLYPYRVAEWHSGLSPKTKCAIWHGIIAGTIDVIIGARSALFMPFKNIKLIVVDEEHDASFKQEEGVIYGARDMAIMRAKLECIPIILSTATPASETYYNAIQHKYIMHEIQNRYTNVTLPEIHLIDLTKHACKPNKWISAPLTNALNVCMQNNKIAMLFLNNRGYARLTICKACKQKFECPNCECYLIEHKHTNNMLCHYCGFTKALTAMCTRCSSNEKLISIGPGIERIEEELKELFPSKKIIVLSSDTIGSIKKASTVLSEIESGVYNIILGTQMITKGFNFPNLHLIGVIDADTTFSRCDLKSTEQAFQLIYQVAGRAGREYQKGEVYIQTLTPQNILLQYMRQWDYTAFINNEIQIRCRAALPPFSKIATILGISTKEKELDQFMHKIVRLAPAQKDINISGPSPCNIYKIKSHFRYRIILRAFKGISIQQYIAFWFTLFTQPTFINIKIDIDPYTIM